MFKFSAADLYKFITFIREDESKQKDEYRLSINRCWESDTIRELLAKGSGIWNEGTLEMTLTPKNITKVSDAIAGFVDELDADELIDDEDTSMDNLDVQNFMDLIDSFLVFHYVQQQFDAVWIGLGSFDVTKYYESLFPTDIGEE